MNYPNILYVININVIRAHLYRSMLLEQFHFFLEGSNVPDLDGPVPQSADDRVSPDFDVVHVVGTLERRFVALYSSQPTETKVT